GREGSGFGVAQSRTKRPTSAIGWDHLIGYADDAAHPFGESDEGSLLLRRTYESPQMDDAAAHDDVVRTKVGPVLIGQARQQLLPDLGIRLLRWLRLQGGGQGLNEI